MITAMQQVNLEREIQKRKDAARVALIDAFWRTRTRSQLLAYGCMTVAEILALPEFQEFVRELVNPEAA